ncbi:MAG: DUF393 domain-containing protein [Pseudomonadota bacterium]
MPPKDKEPVTVYFDGACPLCTVEIDHYSSRPGAEKLSFVDVSEGGDPAPDLASDVARRRFHVRRADGTLLSGARAFVEVWDTLPGWRWLARVARVPGIVPVLELAYRGFLPIRPMLSRIARWFGARNRQERAAARNV